ncbi:asparagine synthase-related protein [Roseibacterium sp. SDUM158016]|uniref:asparagine synthase-related protein n=1 Tax=Roseicyclus sediminis TaxID=2980997 RepID=UPI0021CF8DF9|nr:asparagine synthase-related protein [Roseibacterium sp. SDUM158016]MCU4653923.1 asparagine synthase-related protein [Roseibacterium sp. SDUM158016]
MDTTATSGMSAILGRIELDGRPIDEDAFRTAASAMITKRLTSPEIRISRHMAFAGLYLPVSRTSQEPRQVASDGRHTLIADAILDDRPSLVGDLTGSPSAWPEAADCDLLLAAWDRWNADSPRHVIGDFSFVVWDREERELNIVQDHVGTRPIYWSQQGKSVVFASNIRFLLAFEDLSWVIDEEVVARFLCNPSRPLAKCFWSGMHIARPGTVTTLRNNGVSEATWWTPARKPQRPSLTPEECSEELRGLVKDATLCRIDTDFPIASHLSGGIDSVLVSTLAARELSRQGRTLRTYTWAPAISDGAPDLGDRDERHIIQQLAQAEGLDCHFGSTSGQDLRHFMAGPIELDGPANLLDELETLKDAEDRNIRVIISGWGGDEAFSANGLGYLAYLLRTGQFDRAWRVLRRYARSRHPKRILKVLWRSGIAPNLPQKLSAIWSPFDTIYPERCFISEALERRHPEAVAEASAPFQVGNDPKEYMARLIEYGHLGERMRTWDSWAWSRGTIYRYPLTDRRLMDFILSLPAELLFADGQSRHLARKAFSDELPKRLSTQDPANQRSRSCFKRECWELLRREVIAGTMDIPENWLRSKDLRAMICNVPDDMKSDNLLKFSDILGAMRMVHLHDRLPKK